MSAAESDNSGSSTKDAHIPARNAKHHHPNRNPINNHEARPSSSSALPTQACAACKYQRRKCNPDCTLAPYFPADAQHQFLNAHRLFGVRNILKIIRELDPVQRPEAMHSIIFQSNARAHDPVGGCYSVILELEGQLKSYQAELAHVLHQLAVCRSQAQAPAAALSAQANPQRFPPYVGIHTNRLLTANEDGDDPSAMYVNHHAGLVHTVPQVQQQQYYNYFYYDGEGENNNSENYNENHNSHSNSNSISSNKSNHKGVEMEVPQSAASMLSLLQQCSEDGVKPLVEMFEVRQALALGKEEDSEDLEPAPAAFSRSTDMMPKEELNQMKQAEEHDLKGAASLFTLTNYNTYSDDLFFSNSF